jgi:fluoroquinolone transport system ATP-binding protein
MIRVRNLSYTYAGQSSPTIRDISFQVENAEIFGFLGPSGAGKSTTQKILTGVLKNYEGSVVLKGEEISKISKHFYNNIGVAFEFPNFYLKFTALENLQLFASFYNCEKYDAEILLKKVGLWDDRNLKVEAYSKGMRMRLNFIRAVLHQPKLLFLDEPTSGLDPTNARILKDFILELREKGTTIFLTTHNMTDADELCDRIAFMVEGQLPLIDEPDNLKLKYGKKTLKVKYHHEENSVQEEFELKGLGTNNEFQKILAEREIETIHTQEATLEDIFIKITGKKLV